MFTKLKICGVTSLEDALNLVDAGVDILGFNFFSGSPRYITLKKAKNICRQLPFFVTKVGILVKPAFKQTQITIEGGGIDALQIYEPQNFNNYFEIQVPVIHVVRMEKNCKEIKLLPGYNKILLDSFSAKQFGGTGDSFEWSTIPDFLPAKKLVLAGGINPGNIRNALEQVGPAIVDVASGCEISPGKKDINKVKNLVRQVYDFNFRNLTDEN